MPVGVVAFSFALRADEAREPSPCNIALACEVVKILNLLDRQKDPFVVVAQWEVAQSLQSMGVQVDHIVEPSADGSYLDSEEVWRQAKEVFAGKLWWVAPVAQPFLQMHKITKMIEDDGLETCNFKIKAIGFDRESSQWWTRSWWQLTAYAVMQKLFGWHGHRSKQSVNTAQG